jgi:hypothetical protein
MEGIYTNRTSDVRLDYRVFNNRRPGLRLGFVLVKIKEDAKLLNLSI